MRILHLTSLYPPRRVGGAEKVVSQLAEAQVAAGHDVAACYLVPEPEAEGCRHGVRTVPLRSRNPLWIEDSGRFPAPLRVANKLATVFNMRISAQFGEVVDRVRPDVVHTHSLVELPPMVWAEAARRGARVVHTLHDYDLLCVRAALFRQGRICATRHLGCAAVSRWKRRYVPRVAAVTAVSRPVLDRHLEAGCFVDLPETARHVVWNPVDLPASPAPLRPPRGGDLVFGFIGRLVAEKGIELLLEAARSLPASGWRLRIAGRAPGNVVRLAASARGLPVEFVGFAEAGSFLADIDVLVAPALWLEPFGLSVLEALAAGVPVIGSDIGGIGEILGAAGATDWLVQPGNVVTLAGTMRAAIDRRLRYPRQATVDALLASVNLELLSARYAAIYQSVLSG